MSSMKNIAVSFTKMSKAHTDAPAHAGAPKVENAASHLLRHMPLIHSWPSA